MTFLEVAVLGIWWVAEGTHLLLWVAINRIGDEPFLPDWPMLGTFTLFIFGQSYRVKWYPVLICISLVLNEAGEHQFTCLLASEPPREDASASAFILNFPVSRMVRNKLLFVSPPVCGILVQQPKLTEDNFLRILLKSRLVVTSFQYSLMPQRGEMPCF